MENEITMTEVELQNLGTGIYDLESTEDRNKLEHEFNSGSMFFKPENDVTYKITLTNSKIVEVKKTFGDEEVIKYAMQIKAENKSGVKFEGVWEVGKSVLEPIFKNYSKDAVFKITKTGSGKETRYSVVADF